ncbi:hypothetical protein MRX96_002957 [Rhipicephalus microplus]
MVTTFEGVSLRAVNWFDNRPVTFTVHVCFSFTRAGREVLRQEDTNDYVVVVNCWLLYRRDATAANVPCKAPNDPANIQSRHCLHAEATGKDINTFEEVTIGPIKSRE